MWIKIKIIIIYARRQVKYGKRRKEEKAKERKREREKIRIKRISYRLAQF